MHVSNNWSLEDRDGLKLIFSPLLSSIPEVVHAFTTRIGGTSSEPLEHFNLGRHWPTPESKQDALANRERLCKVLGLEAFRLVVPGQVHSVEVHWVTEPRDFPAVDGLATTISNTPLLVHFADCVPIILVDVKHKAISVVHAGWRGTAGSIASRGVSLLKETTGVSSSNIVAAIGPAIGSCCYPTSQEVAEQLVATVSDKKGLIAFHKDNSCPDLKAINARQLSEAGIREIDVSSYCTACHPELFYSHRQSGGKTGRQGAIACFKN